MKLFIKGRTKDNTCPFGIKQRMSFSENDLNAIHPVIREKFLEGGTKLHTTVTSSGKREEYEFAISIWPKGIGPSCANCEYCIIHGESIKTNSYILCSNPSTITR
jgi:formamidopyrimidine-DNA glycosylase